MKKLSTLAIVLLFSFSFVYSQSKKTDRQKDNLIGQVKSVEDITYKAKEKFGDVVPDVKQFTTLTEFSKEGDMKNFEFVDVEDKEKTTRTYKYNDKNLVIEQKEIEDGEVLVSKIIYDSKDRVVEINEYDKKGDLQQKVKNKYDTAGRLLRSDLYDSDGTLRLSEMYEYDFFLGAGLWKKKVNKKAKTEEHWIYELGNSEENPTRLRRFDGEGEFVDLDLDFGGGTMKMRDIKPKDPKKEIKTTSYTYNKNGLVTLEETETTRNHIVSSTLKRIFEYDKYGNKTLEKDSEKYYTTYTYEYDAKGNWIKQVETRFSYGSTYHYISERKIKYY